MAIDAVGTTERDAGQTAGCRTRQAFTRHRRQVAGGVTAMLDRFSRTRNLSDQYLRVYSEPAGKGTARAARVSLVVPGC